MIRINLIKAVFLGLLSFLLMSCGNSINRKELVKRHIVKVDSMDILSSLSVGNGRFAFTVDFTGLQSFPSLYERGVPLGTQSEWGWHAFPNEEGFTFDETLVNYDYYGRQVPFSVQSRGPMRRPAGGPGSQGGRPGGGFQGNPAGQPGGFFRGFAPGGNASNYFRENPHRLHLGIVGLDFFHEDGSPVEEGEIANIHQTLDPWAGEIHSSFTINDTPVDVTTYGHHGLDLVSSRIKSPLIKQGLIRVKLHFPYGSAANRGTGCDWSQPEKHRSVLNSEAFTATIQRQLDTTSYSVYLAWDGSAEIYENEAHYFYLAPGKGQSEFSFSCLFTPEETEIELPDFNSTALSSKEGWKSFWMSGGAVDFSGSTDPRAMELERRIVLSQYLECVQSAQKYPPQETGLTYNSWYGKFHLEMHWWHGVHWPLWNRSDFLERSFDFYTNIVPKARETAKRQGFDGVRWPKMTSPTGVDGPSSVGSFLIWQQPHIIYMAELCYQVTHNEELLRKYSDIVFETADFMASYAHYDSLNDRYVLGPLLIPAQERLPLATTINPPLELAYWYWGLKTAQEWRRRLNLERKPEWDAVLNGLPPLAQKDGVYLAAESAPDSYENTRYMSDHPAVLGAYGMMPATPLVDPAIMRETFDYVWENWHWEDTWGWDFPMTAMTATRLGLPDKAVNALFMDIETNTYLPNGHNYQNQGLTLYLPGNGGLLTAVAMMCAGYDGCEVDLPGFPKDGTWKVKWEGLNPLP